MSELINDGQTRVVAAFKKYLEALDAGQGQPLAPPLERDRHDLQLYRALRTAVSRIDAVDAHDEGTFITWSVSSDNGTDVARFSAIVSMVGDDIVVNQLVSHDIDERALVVTSSSAPMRAKPRSSQYWVRRWEGHQSVPPGDARPITSSGDAPQSVPPITALPPLSGRTKSE